MEDKLQSPRSIAVVPKLDIVQAVALNELVCALVFRRFYTLLDDFTETIVISPASLRCWPSIVVAHLPGIERFLFFVMRERVILDNFLRLFEVCRGICNLVFQLFRHCFLHYDPALSEESLQAGFPCAPC